MEEFSWLKDVPKKALSLEGVWYYLVIEATDNFFRIFYKNPHTGEKIGNQEVLYDFSNLDTSLNSLDTEMGSKGFLFMKNDWR